MRRVLFPLVVLVVAIGGVRPFVAAQTPATPEPVVALSQPTISPDGATIAFAAGGDIWTAPAAGGTGRLLVADPALETRPLFSPDGKWLAFNSTRSGSTDVYLFELATGHLRRLTFDDGNEVLDGWSPDGAWIYFDSTAHNVAGSNDVYRVSVLGGTPFRVASDRYVNEFFGAAAPDGSIAFSTRGTASSQWWRNGTSHIDETEIWRLQPATNTYTRLLPDGAKQLWPMFSADGRTLYYTSTRGGVENLWALPTGGQPRQLTNFTTGRVLWPSIGAGGNAIVFQRDFGVWKLDLKSGKAAPVVVHLMGSPAAPGIEHLSVTTAQNMAVSPDGRKVVFTAHGELFAAGVDAGGQAVRVTDTGRLQIEPVWLNDSRRVVYISDRTGHDHLYMHDFVTNADTTLTDGDSDECHLALSPDGKTLVFQRGTTDVMSMDLSPANATHQAARIAKGYFGRPPLGGGTLFAWSPDSRWLGYLSESDGTFRNAYVVPAAGGDAREVSFIPNADTGDLNWSPDGKFLIMSTSQRTEAVRIARVDLAPRTPFFAEDRFHELFESTPNTGRAGRGQPAGGAAGEPTDAVAPNNPGRRPVPPVEIVFDGISRRMSLLPMTDARNPTISPDGRWLAYVATGNIYLYSLDEEGAPAGRGGRGGGGRGDGGPGGPRQLTTTPGAKNDLQFTADSRQLFFLEGGRISHIDISTGGPAAVRTVNVTADLDVDFNQEKQEVFEEAWRYLRDDYMNPAMNGVDWNAVHARYAPVVAGASSPDDLRQVLSLMIGDLNSSHSGIMAGGGGGGAAGTRRPTTGRLGVFFDRVEYEGQGKLCVSEVIPLGPAAIAGLKVGDCISAIDDHAVGARTNLDEILTDTVGRKVMLDVASTGEAARHIAIKPIAGGAEKTLLYDGWVEHNRHEVETLSGGTLGYIHMQDMSQQALDRLYLDLDATNFSRRGVVIDVRNNTGGFVNAYALDVLTRRPYITMTPRGFPQGPARTSLGQRALEKPTVLITNQNSLSDSEDFTEGYRTMQLGKVVGVPTAGWIIFTSNVNLIDGSSVRLPFTRILDHDGKDMEMHPRPVDVEVQDPIGSWSTGHDAQLEAAVKTLTTQLAAATPAKPGGGR